MLTYNSFSANWKLTVLLTEGSFYITCYFYSHNYCIFHMAFLGIERKNVHAAKIMYIHMLLKIQNLRLYIVIH